MGSLSSIVNVAVSTLATQVQQPGFGLPLIADYHTRWAERVRLYSGSPDGLAAMVTDGFLVTDAAYLAASRLVAQSPAVPQFAIGRRALAPDLQVDLFPTAANLSNYVVDLVGPAGLTASVSYLSDATATVAEIVAGLVSAINTAAVGITATNVGPNTNVRCKAAAAGTWFSVSVRDISLNTAKQTHADPGIATDLAAILAESQAWYGLTLTTQGSAEIVAAAAWVEANKRIAVLGSQDSDIANNAATTDVASTVKTANEFRSAVFYKTGGDQFQGAALLGSVLPLDPGKVTAWGRKLASQNADTLTETHLANLLAKNAMWFTTYGGIAITRDGKCAAGGYLDTIRDRDFLESRLQTDVFTVLTNSDKVPFTDKGASAVIGAVKARLDLAVTDGILSDNPAPQVIGPTVATVATADKAARKYKPITFTATLAGAIQAVNITGTVTV